VQVAIKEDHQLKTDGYYTNVRHPSHTASLLSFIGFGGIVLVDRDPDVVTTNLMKKPVVFIFKPSTKIYYF
jgi:protein-S-isoprenylcysteine O-methyltransferase Ste14